MVRHLARFAKRGHEHHLAPRGIERDIAQPFGIPAQGA
jgi:hypothetical protein